MIATYIPFAVAATLLAASIIDLRTGKIPNWFSYVFIVLFAVLVAVSPEKSPYIWQFAFAAAAFAMGLALYAVVGFGAGAVKLLFGAALFLPFSRTFAIFMILLVSMFFMGLIVTLMRGAFGNENSKWRVLKDRVMPMSLPVTVTSLLAMFWLQA